MIGQLEIATCQEHTKTGEHGFGHDLVDATARLELGILREQFLLGRGETLEGVLGRVLSGVEALVEKLLNAALPEVVGGLGRLVLGLLFLGLFLVLVLCLCLCLIFLLLLFLLFLRDGGLDLDLLARG
jgi:hypothetical protein